MSLYKTSSLPKPNLIRSSKFLSLVLRHKPEKIGLTLDKSGWVLTADLLKGCADAGHSYTLEELRDIVANNDKKRFEFSEDDNKIRAVQGHSLNIELGYKNECPPKILFHGTARRNLDSIKAQGLLKRNRQYVHLSLSVETAGIVGQRHGEAVILPIQAKEMYLSGKDFFLAPNGVWLTEYVEPKFIDFSSIRFDRDG